MTEQEPEFLLELEGLEHCLFDAESGESFTVRVTPRLQIMPRTLVALLGPSGCGKTTLLSLLGLLRSPVSPDKITRFSMSVPDTKGNWVQHDLRSIWKARQQRKIEKLRRQHIGFALQNGELLPALTVRENIMTPLRLNGVSRSDCNNRVDELLRSFGLEEAQDTALSELTGGEKKQQRSLRNQRINRLSGGEYQRVALARAIAHSPSLVFVDEPTSNLNRELAHEALRELRTLQCGPDSQGAVVMITHDEELAATFADVIVRMAPNRGEASGELVEVRKNIPTVDSEEDESSTDPLEICTEGTS
ncbi:Bacitracin export ATP-binding protein BceA [Gimesia maris]|uniref:ABC transporter ATP-binding protein n=1 Tax=Gimesia maris TaxID=122 RepID=UPI001189442F|nr:ATP-binding cassette domain-containing protein [Gimesia maris]QDU17452.1 Bacitracin export ATP-binding protein BceA [Gimesia maris]